MPRNHPPKRDGRQHRKVPVEYSVPLIVNLRNWGDYIMPPDWCDADDAVQRLKPGWGAIWGVTGYGKGHRARVFQTAQSIADRVTASGKLQNAVRLKVKLTRGCDDECVAIVAVPLNQKETT